MSIIEKLKKIQVKDGAEIMLRYEAGQDVMHYTDNYYDDVIAETTVASSLANLTTNLPAAHTRWSKAPIIETMRDDGYFEDYSEEEIDASLITEIISEYWNECDWLSFSTEKYDHKRGYATLSTEVMVPYNEVVNAEEWMLTGWTAVVKTDLGTLEIK